MTGAQATALLKKRGWVLNLLFIFVGAYLLAGATNSVVASNIRAVPIIGNMRPLRIATTPAGQEKITYLAMSARNLLDAKRENLNPILDQPPEDTAAIGSEFDEGDLRPCTIAASLRATLVADEAAWSVAVIYNNSKRASGVYSINEGSNSINANTTLVAIRSREIIVRRRDHFERCQGEGEGGKASKSRRPTAAPSRSTTANRDDGSGVRKTGDNEYEVTPEYLQTKVLDNLSRVATQARIVPSFKNGKPNGFKLFSIKPGSIYTKLGMQNGDVVQKINGYEMNSPDKALEIYQKLKTTTSVTVDYLRRGKNQTSNINIR